MNKLYIIFEFIMFSVVLISQLLHKRPRGFLTLFPNHRSHPGTALISCNRALGSKFQYLFSAWRSVLEMENVPVWSGPFGGRPGPAGTRIAEPENLGPVRPGYNLSMFKREKNKKYPSGPTATSHLFVCLFVSLVKAMAWLWLRCHGWYYITNSIHISA